MNFSKIRTKIKQSICKHKICRTTIIHKREKKFGFPDSNSFTYIEYYGYKYCMKCGKHMVRWSEMKETKTCKHRFTYWHNNTEYKCNKHEYTRHCNKCGYDEEITKRYFEKRTGVNNHIFGIGEVIVPFKDIFEKVPSKK